MMMIRQIWTLIVLLLAGAIEARRQLRGGAKRQLQRGRPSRPESNRPQRGDREPATFDSVNSLVGLNGESYGDSTISSNGGGSSASAESIGDSYYDNSGDGGGTGASTIGSGGSGSGGGGSSTNAESIGDSYYGDSYYDTSENLPEDTPIRDAQFNIPSPPSSGFSTSYTGSLGGFTRPSGTGGSSTFPSSPLTGAGFGGSFFSGGRPGGW